MLNRYRHVLSVPGAIRFSGSALVARLPISMVTIGVVLLVTAATGSYARAGSLSAVYLLAAAALAIPQARLVDRVGQGTVLVPVAVGFAISMSLFVWSVQERWPVWTSYLLIAGAGVSFPQIGSCVRARWSHVVTDRGDLNTAYALESAIDEAVFITGPILVTVLATTWQPFLGLAAAIVAGTAGTLAFASQRATEPIPHRARRSDGPRPGLPWRTIGPASACGLTLGALFGATEVATVAFAAEHHARPWTGVLLALWALGSLIAGLATGLVHWRAHPATRLRRGSLAMACTMVPLSFIGSLPVMGAVLLLAGFAIAPTLIASLTLVEQTMPHGRLTEGMAIVNTALVAGVAPGAAIGGHVVDARGASAAYLVPLVAGALTALAALTLPRYAAAERVGADGRR